MMMSLFISFDPSTNLFNLNWMSLLIWFYFIPLIYWLNYSNFMMMFKLIMNFIYKEFSIISMNKTNLLLSLSLFFYIILNNFMGLFPYIFTNTSHMTLNFSLALTMWFSFILFNWMNYTNKMFSHLIPNNTPFILMPFMVCIEIISIIIRPLTLMIRLMANMISGHLLLTLLGNIKLNFMSLMIIPIQMTLNILELSISMIQAYVFSILITLYLSEN
uniref:ATP synthase subunit a n=1 Tax=Metopiellus crypticus TaxID=3140185 RepID=A0AAT9QEL8_9COLE|nr:ATP synthase F0 subunit 6 [Metopiellus sp.]UUK33561.1 ATP synthase F0 subunit 6 [Metopiellus sp.]UUK33574.1 ATP synthase F0 subunit 6 [Metopiellus sp.]